jgi:hypothetical protein
MIVWLAVAPRRANILRASVWTSMATRPAQVRIARQVVRGRLRKPAPRFAGHDSGCAKGS